LWNEGRWEGEYCLTLCLTVQLTNTLAKMASFGKSTRKDAPDSFRTETPIQSGKKRDAERSGGIKLDLMLQNTYPVFTRFPLMPTLVVIGVHQVGYVEGETK